MGSLVLKQHTSQPQQKLMRKQLKFLIFHIIFTRAIFMIKEGSSEGRILLLH